jgi:thymidine kinase
MTERKEAIVGSMFSGKTAEVIEQATRHEIAGRKVQIFKPIVDTRWGLKDKVRSHAGAEHDATSVKDSLEILEKLEAGVEVVAIDEAQFFDERIIDVILELSDRDIFIIFAGLPEDFRGETFGPMGELLPHADAINRLKAICNYEEDGKVCGGPATKTQRFVNGEAADYNDPIVLIGEKESYAARCPKHHIVRNRPKRNLERVVK